VTQPARSSPSLFSVELRTARWPALVEWYRSVLGLRVLVRVVDDGYALFEAGDTRLAILRRPEPGEASRRWSLGFEVTDLDAIHDRLVAANAEVAAPKVHPEGFREVVTADPDGNRIRLFSWPEGHA
jgi:predicted enzyme related to lactoylglutathione lyase